MSRSRRSSVRVPISVRHDVAVGVTSSHDKESSTTTVTAHRWCVLAARTTTSASKALSTGKKLRVRSDYVMRVRRCVGGAIIVPNDLPGHHGDEAPRRKLSLGSCCARASSALRVSRPAIVSECGDPYRQPGYDADAQDIHACCVRFAAVSRLCRTFRGRFADITRSVSHVSRTFRTFRGPYTHLRAPTQPRCKAIAHHSRTFRNVWQRFAALRAEPMHTIQQRPEAPL